MENRIRKKTIIRQWMGVAFGTIMLVGIILTQHYYREYVMQKAMETAANSLETAVDESFVIINKVELASNDYVKRIEEHLGEPDMMFDFSKQILAENPELKGCSVAFEPNYFEQKGKYFSAYSYKDTDGIKTEQEGDENYQYFCMDWYLIPRQLNKRYWIEPFAEFNVDGIVVKDVMTSYCQPLHDSDGNTVGILSADVPLKWLSDSILKHHPFPQSYCMLLGRGGTYIVHPDSTRLLYESILTSTLESHDPDLIKLGRDMIDGNRGQQTLNIDGVKSHVFYMPFGDTGWSLALVCPDEVLMSKYNILSWVLMVLIFISILIILTPMWNLLSKRGYLALKAQKGAVMALVLGMMVSCGQKQQPTPAGDTQTETKQEQQHLSKQELRSQQARNQIIEAASSDDKKYFALLDSLEEAKAIVAEEADYWRADHYYDLQKFRTAVLYYKKAVANDVLKNHYTNIYYKAMQGLYTAYFNAANIEEALSAATTGYQCASKDSTLKGHDWANSFMAAIGSSQMKLGHIEEAEKTLAQAIENAEKMAVEHPDNDELQETCMIIANNVINSYLNRYEFDKAGEWLTKLERGLERYAATDVNMEFYERYLSNILADKAVIFYKQGRIDEAMATYQTYLATDYAKSYSGIYDQAYFLEVTEQWDKLLDIQLTIDSSEVAAGINPTLDFVIESPVTTFKALEKTGRKEEAIAKAYQIFELLDSVKEYQHRSDAEELAVIYETQQKEEQIALQQAELSQQRLWMMGLLFFVLLAFFVVYSMMRQRASRRLAAVKAAQERIEGELQIARDIQMSMLPHEFPKREGLDMYALMTPAKEVGGDMYGYMMNGDNMYFCVGDVSGKGVPASLFMAQATSLFRTLASQGLLPAEICTRMNDVLSGKDNVNGMFFTMFIGVIDLTTGHMYYCNAGHNPPVLGGGDTGGDFLKMEPNVPIGLWTNIKFIGEEVETLKGHPFFIYTDGLNEAENKEQKQFGEKRMLDILRQIQFNSAQQVVERMQAEIIQHRDGAEPNDDLTMMCIEVK